MSAYRLGTVLFTVMGIGLIVFSLVMGGELLVQVVMFPAGLDMGRESWLRIVTGLLVPSLAGVMLLGLRETLARRLLSDDAAEPATLSAGDFVRAAIVGLGVWFVTHASIQMVTALVASDGVRDIAWAKANAGSLVELAAGILLTVWSKVLARIAWGTA